MRRSLALSISALAMLAMGVTACGGDDGGGSGLSGTAGEYADAIASEFEADPESGVDFTDDEARCIAGEMVDAVGVDAFEDAGIEPSDITDGTSEFSDFGQTLSDEQAADVVDAVFGGDCVDFAEMMGEAFVAESGGQVTEEQGRCMGEGFIENQDFKDAMVGMLLGNEDADVGSVLGSVMEMLGDCGIDPMELGG